MNTKIVRFAYTAVAKLKNNGPAILTGASIVSGIAACIVSYKTPKKTELVKLALEKEKADIQYCSDHRDNLPNKTITYTDEDVRNDLKIAYAHSTWGYIKAYTPIVLLEGISIGCAIASHGIMKKRNTALVAACATVTDMFTRYRQNVRERFGDEVDRDMRYGLKREKIKEQIIDENGKKKTVVKEYARADKDLPWRSDYAKLYQEGCRSWCKDPYQNYLTVSAQEALANRLLQKKGYLFLNEVYQLLGIDETKAGSEVGWIYSADNTIGNNYISFGLDKSPDFEKGLERNVWLDFNVDGPIRHRIKWAKF